jgi:hypothetical protein
MRGDAEVDDEDRLAAALVVLALARGGGGVPDGDLARWRARRLAALRQNRGEVTPARPAGRGARG